MTGLVWNRVCSYVSKTTKFVKELGLIGESGAAEKRIFVSPYLNRQVERTIRIFVRA